MVDQELKALDKMSNFSQGLCNGLKLIKLYRDQLPTDDLVLTTVCLASFSYYSTAMSEPRILNILVDLSSRPAMQNLLVNEQKAIMKTFGRSINLKSLSKMKYLDAFIKESLLLSAPAILKETILSNGITIPQNGILSINLFQKFHNKKPGSYIERVFDPARHRIEKADSKEEFIYSLLWGAGNDTCPFKKYSIEQLKLFVAIVLRKYDIVSVGDQTDTELERHLAMLEEYLEQVERILEEKDSELRAEIQDSWERTLKVVIAVKMVVAQMKEFDKGIEKAKLTLENFQKLRISLEEVYKKI
ncbi:hypothetical protein BB560_001388 [Smittium megazygosporum]|uniref:Uncharacterized protein n=1 Tax=Smittium megazygosporum TaxID=133381 RepID=A0A2T9ZHR4_9FUNG|nr:hypothetical protein BB560_001388 [Smittium megazygosporum]